MRDEPTFFPALLVKMSQAQRDFLIEHIDRERPIFRHIREDSTRASMVRLNLVNYVRAEAGFPKATRLTDTGREMVCALLAQEADRAVAALGKLDAVTVPTFRAALVYAFAVRGDGSTLIQPDRPLKSVKTEEESKRQENGRGESNITHDFARNRCTDSLDSIGPSQAPQKTEAADQSDHHGQDADIRGRDST